ncbi:MAG: hypothetical protein GZ091_13275 [Paludibacter sp.]|nr:hypothetical protein [Paludibacter sp.]
MYKVIVDPACNFYYSSYYINGLIKYFGKNLIFSSKLFKNLNYTSETHIFAFVIINGKDARKFVIDFADAPNIENEFHNWCDVYGKVNYRAGFGYTNKVVACAPNFAMKVWNKPFAGTMAFFNYLKCFNRTVGSKMYISRYLMTCKRKNEVKNDVISLSNYIFFISTFWKGQEKTNRLRASFIRACKSISLIEFEGGLLPDSEVDKEYLDVLISASIDYNLYYNKIRQSSVVFNTPAYHLCHGWKLPEFLGMGKAIISTQFVNELPIPLIHGENIYFVSDKIEDIKHAIEELTNNHTLRTKLENGALEYYNKYNSPFNAIRLLISHEISI